MRTISSSLPPRSHLRIEELDAADHPRIGFYSFDGNSFQPWDSFLKAVHLGIVAQRAYARGLTLLLDFIETSGVGTSSATQWTDLLSAFVSSLERGTIDGCQDPTFLYWQPRTGREVRRILTNLELFFRHGLTGWNGIINPVGRSSLSDRLAQAHHHHKIRYGSLLSHLKLRNGAPLKVTASGVASRKPQLPIMATKRFPEIHFNRLMAAIAVGHRAPWAVARDQMILLLLHGGGLRIGAPFTMWSDDVYVDPDDNLSCIVRLYHPTEGDTTIVDPLTGKAYRTSRIARLAQLGLSPRNEAIGHDRHGTKNHLLTNGAHYSTMFWRNPKVEGRNFKALYNTYIKFRPRPLGSHPYLFVSSKGLPYTSRCWAQVHRRAVERIGLEYAKDRGTTPHGHRHAYGHWLGEIGIRGKVRQVALMHRNILSQETYETPTEAESYAAIEAARIRAGL
ncbi:integrase [Rhodanobacter sp. TND4EL1]